MQVGGRRKGNAIKGLSVEHSLQPQGRVKEVVGKQRPSRRGRTARGALGALHSSCSPLLWNRDCEKTTVNMIPRLRKITKTLGNQPSSTSNSKRRVCMCVLFLCCVLVLSCPLTFVSTQCLVTAGKEMGDINNHFSVRYSSDLFLRCRSCAYCTLFFFPVRMCMCVSTHTLYGCRWSRVSATIPEQSRRRDESVL